MNKSPYDLSGRTKPFEVDKVGHLRRKVTLLKNKVLQLEEENKRLQALAVSSSKEGTNFYYKDAYEASAKQQTKYYNVLRKIREQYEKTKHNVDIVVYVREIVDKALED